MAKIAWNRRKIGRKGNKFSFCSNSITESSTLSKKEDQKGITAVPVFTDTVFPIQQSSGTVKCNLTMHSHSFVRSKHKSRIDLDDPYCFSNNTWPIMRPLWWIIRVKLPDIAFLPWVYQARNEPHSAFILIKTKKPSRLSLLGKGNRLPEESNALNFSFILSKLKRE